MFEQLPEGENGQGTAAIPFYVTDSNLCRERKQKPPLTMVCVLPQIIRTAQKRPPVGNIEF